ncbi:thiol reductant ABC exporter subunit CydC [Gorillibacterium sp. sgz500922]|uniref:thiol reductant ABC exporter subunit CydC n=1 Tax=Gorillibacterium sp. sgz500922 TaxID=3446694 RepID=UPI003F66FFC4
MKPEGWIRPYLKRNAYSFSLIILLAILTVASASMLMFTSGFLISKSSIPPENILLVYVPIVGVRAFSIGRAVLQYVERLVSHNAVLKVLSKVRVRLYRVLEPQALFVRSRFGTGDLLGVLAEDIEQLQNVYLRTVFPAAVAVVLYAAVVAALGFFDVPFALLIALYLFFLVAVLPYASLKATKTAQLKMQKARGGLYRTLTDAVLGIGDYVISGRTKDFVARYERDEADAAAIDRSLRRFTRWRSLAGNFVVGLSAVTLMIWAGGRAADGLMPATLIAAFTLVVFPLMDGFLPVSEAVEKLPQYLRSADRLAEIEAGGLAPVSASGIAVEAEAAAVRLADELHASGRGVEIRFENVSFAYETHAEDRQLTGPGEEEALSGITLELPPGKRVALIGRSGAGKSTLLKLMQGALVPSSGTVTIAGAPAASFGDGIARLVSVLNQSPHLFDTTVRNNIRLGRENASDEEIAEAARHARLEPLLAALPEGLDTPMRETGQRFSGGERQRVALTRVLLQNNPVVILDEPTVGLDPRTERELLATVFTELSGKSLIWVTHHLVGVEDMDEILFLEEGRVAMRGSHDELMRTSERYRNLYRLDRPVPPTAAAN